MHPLGQLDQALGRDGECGGRGRRRCRAHRLLGGGRSRGLQAGCFQACGDEQPKCVQKWEPLADCNFNYPSEVPPEGCKVQPSGKLTSVAAAQGVLLLLTALSACRGTRRGCCWEGAVLTGCPTSSALAAILILLCRFDVL